MTSASAGYEVRFPKSSELGEDLKCLFSLFLFILISTGLFLFSLDIYIRMCVYVCVYKNLLLSYLKINL